jgi:hypothetical protein
LVLSDIFGMLSSGSLHLQRLPRLEVGEVADDRHQLADAGSF